eukprot:6191746-Pleurochrysis_carterae.AAC.3
MRDADQLPGELCLVVLRDGDGATSTCPSTLVASVTISIGFRTKAVGIACWSSCGRPVKVLPVRAATRNERQSVVAKAMTTR